MNIRNLSEDRQHKDVEMEEDLSNELCAMGGADLNNACSKYTDSLHYKIN